jgi:hypothetical protein
MMVDYEPTGSHDYHPTRNELRLRDCSLLQSLTLDDSVSDRGLWMEGSILAGPDEHSNLRYRALSPGLKS